MMRLDMKYVDKFNARLMFLESEEQLSPYERGITESHTFHIEGIRTRFHALGQTIASPCFSRVQKSDQTFSDVVARINDITVSNLNVSTRLERKRQLAESTSDNSLIFTGIFGLLFSLTLLRMFLRQRSMAEKIIELAWRDALTKLPNRRGFSEELTSNIERITRMDDALLVGLIGLVGFKSVNDAYGASSR